MSTNADGHAGDLVLGLVNTRSGGGDTLATVPSARAWLASLTWESPWVPVQDLTEGDLQRLRRLRDEISALLDDFEAAGGAAPPEPAARQRINERLRDHPVIRQIDPAGTAGAAFATTGTDVAGAVTAHVLASLVELAETRRLTSVRTCAAADCSLRFSNPSGRRLWCSPRSCGNRERVRRHYRRRAAG